jgi:hypothetical protein
VKILTAGIPTKKELIVKSIITGLLLLGLLGCGGVSSTGDTEGSQSEQTDTKKKGSIFKRTTREILNANEAVKDSTYVIVELKMQGSDPVTQAFSAYEKNISFVGTLGIQQWIKQEKIVEGHTPTYAELQAWMKKNPGVKLPVMPYKRMYGYDETKGEMVVLEKRDKQ